MMLPCSLLQVYKKPRHILICKNAGMSLIEVLIAVMLFAVFAGVFLMVTEMMAGLVPVQNQSSSPDLSCEGPSLEVACVNSAFDNMVPDSFEKNPDIWLLTNRCLPPSDFMPVGDVAGWPRSYDCIYIIPASGSIGEMASAYESKEVGLFLAEARVDDPALRAFWQLPVQRLFCWPYYKCVNIVR
jgi:prepilin-type N-terminal cleavage/methylation domain-containing protein